MFDKYKNHSERGIFNPFCLFCWIDRIDRIFTKVEDD